MFKNSLQNILIISLLVVLSACNGYNKLQKSSDYKLKYAKALEYYDKEDYYKALNLFDQVMPFYRGTDESEDMQYKYAYAYYYQKDFIMASYYFNRFTKTFPTSKYVEECAYMSAYCKYLDSPKYSLDQTNTKEAIKELQIYINTYPYSNRVKKSNELIDELRTKLQKKSLEIAKLYLKMKRYKAAVTSFENLLKEYPDTQFKEEALFRTIEAYYFYASKSVRSKRKERYLEAVDNYNEFISLYPDSIYNKDLDYMVKQAQKEINR